MNSYRHIAPIKNFFLTLFISLFVFVVDCVAHVFWGYESLIFFYFLLIILTLLIMIIVRLCQKQWIKGLCLLFVLLLYPALIIFCGVVMGGFLQLNAEIEAIKVSLFANKYNSCIASAHPVADGKVMNVCDRQEFKNGPQILVYDSSDLLAQSWMDTPCSAAPPKEFPEEWLATSVRLDICPNNKETWPRFLSVRRVPLHPHFYHVEWQ